MLVPHRGDVLTVAILSTNDFDAPVEKQCAPGFVVMGLGRGIRVIQSFSVIRGRFSVIRGRFRR